MSTPAPYTIRLPHPEDVLGAAQVHVQTWRETYTGLMPQHVLDNLSVERRARMWASLIDQCATPHQPLTLRVATVGDAASGVESVVGVGIAGPSKGNVALRDWEVLAIYVLQAHHGTGLGSALLHELVPDARPAQLWVADGNNRAIAFYRKHGFTLTEHHTTDEDGCTETLMVR